MNKPRFLDKCQLLIAIIGLASLLIAVILLIVMLFTATPTYDENHVLTDLTYNSVVQSIFAIFYLTHLTAVTWFIARSITYKLRIKEEDAL